MFLNFNFSRELYNLVIFFPPLQTLTRNSYRLKILRFHLINTPAITFAVRGHLDHTLLSGLHRHLENLFQAEWRIFEVTVNLSTMLSRYPEVVT